MLALIEHSPDIYLDEIQEHLLEQHGIKVSLNYNEPFSSK